MVVVHGLHGDVVMMRTKMPFVVNERIVCAVAAATSAYAGCHNAGKCACKPSLNGVPHAWRRDRMAHTAALATSAADQQNAC